MTGQEREDVRLVDLNTAIYGAKDWRTGVAQVPRFDSVLLHKMPYQPSSRLSGLVSDCTGISVKGLGLALTCFSDVGRQHGCVCAVYME